LPARHFLTLIKDLPPRSLTRIGDIRKNPSETALHQNFQSELTAFFRPDYLGGIILGDLILIFEMQVLINIVSQEDDDIEVISARDWVSGDTTRTFRP
jgi:hypothetical protein